MAKLGFGNMTSLVFSLITISNIIYNKQEQYDKIIARNHWNTEYDYVIVGGGTAGSVVAARLSEDPNNMVLVLEAGGSETVSSNTPGLSESLLGTMVDWKITTVPQNHCCQTMNNRQCLLSCGRVIGGTSSINRMYYLRGNPNDFDYWENRLGLKSWAWKDTFPFFIRNENQTDPERAKSGYFGLNGPVTIEKTSESNKILESFLSASKSSGYRMVDLNTGISTGTSMLQSMTQDGHRMSMSSAFLEPNLKRNNLHILSNSLAFQIIFESNKATGVKFYRNWKSYTVNAKREVIISAGTLNSPKLLMLSGIGPEVELLKHQIPVVMDLPVGENLHDHVGTMGLQFTVDVEEQVIGKQTLKQYFQQGKGPLSEYQYAATVFRSSAGQQLPVIRDTSTTNHRHDSPDLMLLAYVNTFSNRDITAELMEQRTNLKKETWKSYYLPMKSPGKSQLTIVPMVLKPKSRGWVRLKSSNPLDMPLVNANYLHHPNDIEQLVKGIREALRIVNMPPLQRYNTHLFNTIVPGCEQYAPSQKRISNQTLSGKNSVATGEITPTNTVHKSPNFLSTFFRRLFDVRLKQKPVKKGKSFNQTIYDKFWSSSNQNQSDTQWKQDDLIDGFSSSNDMSIIETVWSSHQGPHQHNPLPYTTADSVSTSKYSTNTSKDYSFSVSSSGDSRPITVSTILQSNKPTRISLKVLHQLPTTNKPIQTVQPSKESFSVNSNNNAMASSTDDQSNYQSQHSEMNNHSEQYFQCMARMLTMPIGDYVGTCRMGVDGDWRRVVDSKFRVIGIQGLRVVDASVIPEIVTGGIASIAVVIGERGAEYIISDHKSNNPT